MMVVAFSIFLLFFNRSKAANGVDIQLMDGAEKSLQPGWQFLLAILYGLVFFYLPIVKDVYGDALFLITTDEQEVVTEYHSEVVKGIWNFNLLDTKLSVKTTAGFIVLISYLFQLTAHTAFYWWDAFWGALFVFLWFRTVSVILPEKSGWKGVAILLGLTSPILLNFYGHFETYAPALTVQLWFVYLLLNYIQRPKKNRIFLLIVAILLAIKFHVTGFFLVPALAIVMGHQYFSSRQKVFGWEQTLKFIIVPLSFLGMMIYFFMGYQSAPRYYNEDISSILRSMFLPISAKEGPPLDRYNLFSAAHFWDYMNLHLFWSLSSIGLLLTILIGYRKLVDWKNIQLVVVGSLLIIYVCFFFVLNPLLSMPHDWDLFSFPAIFLMLFTIILLKDTDAANLRRVFYGIVIIGAVNYFGLVYLHQDKEQLSQRYEKMGEYIFRHHWLGASTDMITGLEMEPDREKRSGRYEALLDRIEPYANKGNDMEYGEMLFRAGKHHFQIQDYQTAIDYLNQVPEYWPYHCENNYYSLASYFMIEDYARAATYVDQLVDCGYPDKAQSLKMAIHTTLMAADREKATWLAEQYMLNFPEDSFIAEIYEKLTAGATIKEIQALFAGV